MSKAEILTRTNPKTTNLTGAGGGATEITPSDIMAACTGTDPLGLEMVMVKVCGDRSRQGKVFYGIYNHVITLACRHGWKSPKGKERFRALTQLAMFEVVNGIVCPICQGRKRDPFNKTKPCKACRATGKLLILEDDRAKALSISRTAWYKTWIYRYEKIKEIIEQKEHSAIRRIINNMGE